ncbi:MAG: hypothetical protein IPH80_07780 [Myxococcales bacterium]|nr:hypothetical protein [Myxococcales bacterium]
MSDAPACGHPLCALIGGGCSLAAGVSRGCRAGPPPDRAIAAAVIDEVRGLLGALDPELPDAARRAAAAQLARIIRREAREDRSLLVLAADGDLEPALAERLTALCRRAR